MNHEHPPAEDHPVPKHRAGTEPASLADEQSNAAGEVITDPDADTFVAEVIESALSPEAAEAISAAYRRRGTAFAIYLTLDGNDKYVRDYGPGHEPADPSTIERDFTSSYHGRYPDRDTLIDDVIETFGWQQELDQLLHGRPDLQLAVTFDRDAIYQFASDHYELIQANGTEVIHVFTRWA